MNHEGHHGMHHTDHMDIERQLINNSSHYMPILNTILNATGEMVRRTGMDMMDHSGHQGHEGHAGHEAHASYEAHAGHAGHEGHAGHTMAGGMMSMSMTFHGGFSETILFSGWETKNVGAFIGSFIAIFIIALLYEGLKYYRKHLLWKTYTGLQYCAVSPPDKGVSNITDEPQVIQPMPHALERNIPTMLSKAHAWQTVLHAVQVLVSYMLMLVFMTFNTWLCAAVVLGSAFGYFLFGWRESVVVDFTEHCH